MPREECPPEIHEIGDEAVARICPKRCELETVTRLLACSAPCRIHLMNMAHPRRIGIIFCMRPIRNDENLHVLIEARPRPKAVPLIAIDLVERLAYLHAAPFQLKVYERQPVHKNRHIIAVRVRRYVFPCLRAAIHRILIDALQAIVMDVLLVNQPYILRRSVVTPEVLYIVRLDAACLTHNAIVCGRN